ncbi:hypothetical protein BDP27DRAFT_1452063 [Rhodocollybia butyracea]|uniref:FAD-binding domain-containing protein n=1 Tax=Rhodocollybia butyracea TaxID=206335 RepID=A0A9P5PFL7_9AGAR|nr:hypothetical protein BDP27DRAFT_1452063 [Rhodocollybia butyracea]
MLKLKEFPLNVVVVGAGISGLAVAYLMEKAGHRVTVLEKSSPKSQARLRDGGLRIPPNMTRLLKELPGVDKLLAEKASKCAGLCWVQCHNKSSELMGKVEFPEEVLNDLGCDFHLIPHHDLQGYLYNLCIKAGVQIHHDFDVDKLSIEKDRDPVVFSKTGKRITGDIVIGADGKNSAVRKALLAEEVVLSETDSLDSDDSDEDNEPVPLPMKEIIGATLTVPISSIRSDPELSSFTEIEHWMLWMGNRNTICGARYGPELYVLEVVFADPPMADQTDDEWLAGKPMESVLKYADEYDPRIKKIMQLASTCHWSIQTVHDPPRYVSNHHQVVVIGDAAHAVHLNSAHNTAAGFEDAFTLGRLFSRENLRRSHKSLLLNGYQYIRRNRTRSLELAGMEVAFFLGLPPGREREGRNQGLRLTLHLEGANDETLERLWSTYVDQFNYDARDEVDEWQMNWVASR